MIKPGINRVLVEDDNTEVYTIGGYRRRGLRMIVPAETVEEMRQGYRCMVCLGVQDEPFPEHCRETWCRFEMKRRQLDYLQEQMDPPTDTTPVELKEFDDERDLWEWKRTQSGLVVPPGA